MIYGPIKIRKIREYKQFETVGDGFDETGRRVPALQMTNFMLAPFSLNFEHSINTSSVHVTSSFFFLV